MRQIYAGALFEMRQNYMYKITKNYSHILCES